MERLYNYVFWYNPYQSIWTAVHKNQYIDFASEGPRDHIEYYTDKDIDNLIKRLSK